MTPTRSKTPVRPVRAAVYVRISADHKIGTEQEGAGVERQEALARKLADAKEWQVVEVFSDNDKSATNGKVRPRFEDMLKEIAAGRIDAVIVWHLDRLARKMADLTRIIEVGAPVRLNISAVQGTSLDMGDPTGIAVAQILTAIAGMEVAHKGARQRAANAQRADQGRSSAANRTYGYHLDGTVNDVQASYVKKLFDAFAGGAPITELVKLLDENDQHGAGGKAVGIRRKTPGAGWSRTGVRTVLQNRRYLGEIWYRGDLTATGRPALVEADTFEAVQARLNDPTRTTTTGPARKWLGANCYRCGVCGGPLVSHGSSARPLKDGTPVSGRQYRCPGHLSRLAGAIDTVVQARVVVWLDADMPVKAALKDNSDHAAGRALRDERVALLGKIDQYALDYASDDPERHLELRQCTLLTANANARIAQIDQELAARGRRSALDEVRNSEHPGQTWLAMDIWRKVEVLQEIAVVTVLTAPRGLPFSPESVQIEWLL